MSKINLPNHKFLQKFKIREDPKIDFLQELAQELDEYILENLATYLPEDSLDFMRFRSLLFETFAISKAEDSELKLEEAEKILKNYESQKLTKKTLSRPEKDFRKTEYLNIVKAIKEIEKHEIKDLSLKLIFEIHKIASADLDKFEATRGQKYNLGRLRKNKDKVAIMDSLGQVIYSPPDEKIIKPAKESLIKWVKNKRKIKIIDIAIFHALLYSLHPFSNGNKRVCRILEHFLIKQSGLNENHLYNLSYYYHKYKERYYKNLIATIRFRNLNQWIMFVSEGIVFMMLDSLRKQIELERKNFIERHINYSQFKKDKIYEKILDLFSKKKFLQLKELNRTANLTVPALVKRLRRLEEGGLIKSEVFSDKKRNRYSLNFSAHPEKYLLKKIDSLFKDYSSFPVSNEIKDSVEF